MRAGVKLLIEYAREFARIAIVADFDLKQRRRDPMDRRVGQFHLRFAERHGDVSFFAWDL